MNKINRSHIRVAILLTLGVVAAASVMTPAPAAEDDWGYEKPSGSAKQGHSVTASPHAISKKSRTEDDTSSVSGMSAKALSGDWNSASLTAKKNGDQAFENLREVLELAAGHKLSPDQISDLRPLIKPASADANAPNEWKAISNFWPQVKKRVVDDDSLAQDFGKLLRALFRLVCSSKTIGSKETQVISAILGPQRVTVAGDPELTEEAIDGYCDMACFVYEQKNPGKTVDADDNRAVFATVVRQKFEGAPSPAAKLAMSNFALSWAKFKVVYDLDPDKHPELVQSLDHSSPGDVVQDPLLKKVLDNGPWSKLRLK